MSACVYLSAWPGVYVYPSAFPEACDPGVTLSHEGVAYDTSSGSGQTSPDPSSNTQA